MPGPPPKPTKIKKLEGNPGKRALNASEPRPAEGAPACPPWLSKVAKEKWVEMLTIFELMPGVLSKVDGEQLSLYCQTFSRWRRAEEEIEKFGVTFQSFIEGKDGEFIPSDLKKNPSVTVAEKCIDQMRFLLATFGLDPASRSRLSVSPQGDAPGAALAEFLNEDATLQ